MTTTRPTFADLLAWLEGSRVEGQVHHDDRQQCWHVLGHPEASAVLSDPVVFSSELPAPQPGQDDLAPFRRGDLGRMDPPRHRTLRSLVDQAFTPRVVAGLEPRIAEVTTELLDRAGERFDLVEALARPLPVIVIADLLGLPASDRGLFRRWADVLLGPDVDPDQALVATGERVAEAAAATLREMEAYLLDHVRARRLHPADDLTSRLVQAEVDGQRLAYEEIVGFAGLLLVAGHGTTTATLGNCVAVFAEAPDAAAEVRADPQLLPQAIEEVLRLRTPFPRLTRSTTVDAEVGGVRIPAGQVVLPWLAAANRDGRVFTDPHRFDLRRRPNPHLTFGHGVHSCLGAPLARLEARVALGLLFERYRDIEPAPDEPAEHRNPWTTVAVSRLPLVVRRA